jgi:hypothetical protein
MAYDQNSGSANVRSVLYDAMVKGFANATFKFKQAVNVISAAEFTNYYAKENPTILSDLSSINSVQGIPRGAEFPSLSESWDRASSVLLQFGAEETLSYMDLISDWINVEERSTFRIAEAVANQIDQYILNGLSENNSPTNIQTFAAYAGWNQSSAAIVDDLEQAEQLIGTYYYDTSDLLVYVGLRDKRALVKWLTDKGAQFPAISEGLLGERNGVIGKLGNKTFIVTPLMTVSRALVVVPKRCATLREKEPLSTITKVDEFKSKTIRSSGVCTLQVTDPKAIVWITGTQIGA